MGRSNTRYSHDLLPDNSPPCQSPTTLPQALSSLSPVPWSLLPPLLADITTAVGEMRLQLALLPTGCDPTLFYHRLRPLLSGWKDNPALPEVTNSSLGFHGVDIHL